MTPELWSLSYSPWSDRARWALAHCGVEYRRHAYQPVLGEFALRLKLRRWYGPVSVPVMQTEDGMLADSHAIARWADAHANRGAAKLFPPGRDAEIGRYDELSEAALAAGRTLGLQKVLQDDAALRELLPAAAGSRLGPLGPKLVASAVRRTIRKYAHTSPPNPKGALISLLEKIRRELEAVPRHPDGDRYLLGEFSYADITAATGLSFVLPPSSHLRLGDASRRAYTHRDLAERYADVIAWRDALYAKRDPVRSQRARAA